MRVWDVDVVVTFAERGMSRDTLLTWYISLLTKAHQRHVNVSKNHWGRRYVNTRSNKNRLIHKSMLTDWIGILITFITSIGAIETLLTRRLGKTTLRIDSTLCCNFYRNMDIFIASTRTRTINKTIMNN